MGYLKTLKKAKVDFYWEITRKDIKKLVKECNVCQVTKYENVQWGLLQRWVFKLHGMLKFEVSYQDAIFTSSFWRELFQLQETNIAFSFAYYTQEDGQIESSNKYLESNLRCYVGTRPKEWSF